VVTEMSIERLQQTEQWYGLSPILKEVLTLHFRIGGDLAESVQVTHPYFSRERAEAVANSLLENADVRAVMSLRYGQVVLSDEPPAGSLDALVRRKEWADLQPLKIRLRPDDTSDAGETLDLQRILRLYFTTAREDIRDAVGVYRPDLSPELVADVVRAIWESPDVRRILALRRGAE
jgi:hypothetical protein